MGRARRKPAAATAAEGATTTPELRLEWRSPAELADNPKNWRTHPQGQQDALSGVMKEVGWAGACLYNERTGRLIDGHLRRKVAHANGAEKIPVLVGSWSEADEAKILATLDPLASMAEADPVKLDALIREVETGNEAVANLLSSMAETVGIIPETDKETDLKQLDTMPPPRMSWALIGIPTVRFGEIAETIELLGMVDGIILETTSNDG